jgi:hypothetical protein
MKENIAKVMRVWYSFVKFVKNQVVTNNRCVDTQLIGLIYKDEKQAVRYLPSVEYLEAGKFKIRQGDDLIDGLREQAVSSYKQAYDAKLKVRSKFI